MILDKIENIDIYKGVMRRLDSAFDFIIKNDLFKLKVGKHEIDGDYIFLLMNEYETRIDKAEVLEGHKKYIDLQYILQGTEIIEYSPFNNQEVTKSYDTKNDYLFYKPDKSNRLVFESGMFAVFFPEDLHMPGVKYQASSKIKKVVLKVLID